MTVVPVADARAHLSRLVEEAEATHERFEITRNGRRVAILIGADDYDALRQTIAVLSDTDLIRAHIEGAAALWNGDYVDASGLAAAMREAGRPPRRR